MGVISRISSRPAEPRSSRAPGLATVFVGPRRVVGLAVFCCVVFIKGTLIND